MTRRIRRLSDLEIGRFAPRLVVACSVFVAAVQAQSAVETFLAELNRGLASGERAAVAAAIRYPVIVRIGGLRVPFESASALLDRYDEIFTPELRDAVRPGADATQTPDGFLIGNNVLALARVGGTLKIAGIVVPPPEPRPDTPSSPASGRRVGQPEPRRIAVRAGPGPTRFAGSLPAGAADAYVVFVPKGQLLDVRVERVRGEAMVRVSDAATGAPLNPRVARGALVVSGRAQTSSDYRIVVQRTSTDEAPLPYMLVVRMR